MKNDQRVSGILLSVAFGALLGGVTALLFAPTSGKKLRRKLSSKAEDFYDDAQEYYETGKEKAERVYRDGKKKVSDIVEDAKKIVNIQN